MRRLGLELQAHKKNAARTATCARASWTVLAARLLAAVLLQQLALTGPPQNRHGLPRAAS